MANLLSLPPELREIIYNDLLPTPDNPITVRCDRFHPDYYPELSLWWTCRALRVDLGSLFRSGAIIPTLSVDFTGDGKIKEDKYHMGDGYFKVASILRICNPDSAHRQGAIQQEEGAEGEALETIYDNKDGYVSWIKSWHKGRYGTQALQAFAAGVGGKGRITREEPLTKEKKIIQLEATFLPNRCLEHTLTFKQPLAYLFLPAAGAQCDELSHQH